MAFIGMLIVGVILIVLFFTFIAGIVSLIIGLKQKKRNKKVSKILFAVSGVCFGILLIVIVLAIIPKSVTVETKNGKAIIKPSWIKEYDRCLDENDIAGLRNLVDKHPDMIYYYDQNRVMLLDYGLYNCNIDIMTIAIEHGAVFDEPLRYEHMVFYTSFDSFFSNLDYPTWEKGSDELTKKGETTDEMITAIAFAIENGAAVRWEVNNGEYENDNLFDKAYNWVNLDETVSDKDMELLMLIADSDPELRKKYNAYFSEY